MAIEPVKLAKKQLIALKKEGTPGTVETLTASEVIFIPESLSHKVDFGQKDRKLAKPMLGADMARVGLAKSKISVDVELYGNGSDADAAPPMGLLFEMAGFKGAVGSGKYVYSLEATPAVLTASVGTWRDGIHKLARGCVISNMKIGGEVGWPVHAACEIDGAFVSRSAVAELVGTIERPVPERFQAGTFTIGAYTPYISKFEINIQNTICWRIKPSASGGIVLAEITDRKYTMTIDPEVEALTTRDWTELLQAMTEAEALTIVWGSGTGKVFTITAPNVSVAKDDDEGDQDGKNISSVELNLGPTVSSGGADELLIETS